MNTIAAEVQQVTTRQQAKNADWAKQDEIRKAAKDWLEKANSANVERMKQESTRTSSPIEEDTSSPDSIWQVLAACEITMTMEKLL